MSPQQVHSRKKAGLDQILNRRHKNAVASINTVLQGIRVKRYHSFKRGEDGKRIQEFILMPKLTNIIKANIVRLNTVSREKWLHVSKHGHITNPIYRDQMISNITPPPGVTPTDYVNKLLDDYNSLHSEEALGTRYGSFNVATIEAEENNG